MQTITLLVTELKENKWFVASFSLLGEEISLHILLRIIFQVEVRFSHVS